MNENYIQKFPRIPEDCNLVPVFFLPCSNDHPDVTSNILRYADITTINVL